MLAVQPNPNLPGRLKLLSPRLYEIIKQVQPNPNLPGRLKLKLLAIACADLSIVQPNPNLPGRLKLLRRRFLFVQSFVVQPNPNLPGRLKRAGGGPSSTSPKRSAKPKSAWQIETGQACSARAVAAVFSQTQICLAD